MKRFAGVLMAVLLLGGVWPALSETGLSSASPAPDAAALSAYTPDELLQQWYQIGAMLRENGNYPYVELRKGDTGYEVKALQTRLAELGFYQKEVVDSFGKGTYTAMRLFEKANHLTVDGIASVADQQALFSSTATAYSGGASTSGSSGNDAVSGATSKKD